jgi:hypothetical protein
MGIILKWFFKKWDGNTMEWIDLAQDRGRWQVHVNYGNESSVSIKCGEYLDQLRNR